MSKHQKLWVVIADGEHARIVVPAAAAGSFQTHAGFDAQAAHKRSAGLGADRPCRSFESSGSTRHAIAPKHDLKALEEQKFEHVIGDRLNEASAHVAFDRLVLVAPARAPERNPRATRPNDRRKTNRYADQGSDEGS